MVKVVLLGSGNVASHLSQALLNLKEVSFVQWYSRSEPGKTLLGSIPHTTDLKKLKMADVYILAVSDTAIEELSAKLPFKNRLVLHTSGSVAMKSMDDKNRRGVLYPAQTFTKGAEINFKNVPLCIEAEEEEDFYLLKGLAQKLSDKIYYINSEQRQYLHMAAVFANNFTNHLYHIAHEICKENMVSFDILHPLIVETAKKITTLSPKEAQTGPARRNDKKILKKHTDMLKNRSQRELYELFSKLITDTYGRKKL